MASEWRVSRLGDLVDLFDGPHATPRKTDMGPIFLGISNLEDGRLDLTTTVHLSEEDYTKWTRRVTPRKDDLVFSYETRLGEAALIPEGLRCCLGRRMGLLRAKSGAVDPRFMLYAYLGPDFKETLRSRTVRGSTVDRISLTEMPDFPIRVPDLKTQQAIAHVLGALDERIQLNRRMNQTLEAIARAIFKSWFVDFEPVRAKAAGQQPPGLAPHIAELFPDSFEESELGEIPTGWAAGTLADSAVLNPESWSRRAAPQQIEYVELSTTKWGTIESAEKYPWRDAPSRAQRILRSGDTIIGTVRPGNGSYALITQEGLTGSTGFAVLRPQRSEFQEFIYLAATAAENIKRLAHLADGGAYPAVRPETVAATEVVRPTHSVIEQFSKAVKPLISKMIANVQQSRALAILRDSLLPKLISGELPVPDVERILGRCI